MLRLFRPGGKEKMVKKDEHSLPSIRFAQELVEPLGVHVQMQHGGTWLTEDFVLCAGGAWLQWDGLRDTLTDHARTGCGLGMKREATEAHVHDQQRRQR